MSALPSPLDPSSASNDADTLWTRLARARIQEVAGATSRAPRVLVTGPAGSGKSLVLRHLRTRLHEQGARTVATAAAPDATGVPADSVLFVDDAHLMSDAELGELHRRLDDEEGGMVLACRPWPRSEQLRQVARRLEQDRPPIVLGHLSALELLAHLDHEGAAMTETCLTSLVDMCGSITWLIREALVAHGTDPCLDPEHRAVQVALSELVAERLHTIDPAVAAHVARESLGAPGADTDDEATAMAGYAEGLLLRNGRPAPIVRSAVLATTSVERLAEVLSQEASRPPSGLVELLIGIDDPRVAQGLLRLGDSVVDRDPVRASALYRSAEASGADSLEVTVRLALTAWARGDIDRAGVLVDGAQLPPDHACHDTAVDIAGAIWAARGLMGMSAAAYASADLTDPVVLAHAAITALGSGDREAVASAVERARAARAFPSSVSVAMRLIGRGLTAGLTSTASGTLDDMVQASETYTESAAHGPIPELPAVLAALTAVNLGELDVAHTVLTDALRGGHGGAWAKPRLLLWTAWVALRRQHPDETLLRLGNVQALPGTLSARDRLLRDAVILGHTRRYGDASTLPTVWQRVRDDVLHVQPDLYNLHPLTEFVTTAALQGDSARFEAAFAAAMSLVHHLGDPPAWSAHLHWAGVQQGILRGRPDDLATHAKALVAAAPNSPVAAAMSVAGRVWTEVLTGTVDVDAIEAAAAQLSAVGLAWDGARLASHGAGHTEDRRIVARLLSTARQLHPNLDAPSDGPMLPARAARSHSVLSARELEVAVLVISGKTYAEIGETIYISPRTAEHHIARIRRRLGATSRSDLIAKLRAIVEDPVVSEPGVGVLPPDAPRPGTP